LSKMLHALLADTPLIANLKSVEYLNALHCRWFLNEE
jgi:hypothetical protein